MLKTRFSAACRYAGAVMCAATALIGSAAHATITADWSIAPGAQTYFPAADTSCRGLAYNPVTGNLLVLRSTPNIHVVNEASGAYMGSGTGTGAGTGSLLMTGVTGGGAALSKVRVVDYGSNSYSIFACNISTDTRLATTSPIKIYHWYAPAGSVVTEDTLGAAKVIYSNNTDDGVTSAAGVPTAPTLVVGPKLPAAGTTYTQRVGDTMAVVNSGNNVQIYMQISDTAINNKVLRFDFTNTGNPATDVVSNVTLITLSGLPAAYNYGTAIRGLWVDGYNGAIYHSSNTVFAKFTNAGVYESLVTGTMNSATGGAGGGHPVIGSYNSKNYMVTLAEAGDTASTVAALNRYAVSEVNLTSTANNKFLDVGKAPTATVANTNLTADFAINSTTGKGYFLVSANQIGRFTIPTPAAGVTKKWDNGAATTNWFDAANWAPDGVPSSQDDVVLDNTNVAGAYTVALTATTTEAFARTLTIGGGGNLVTFQIPSTNAVRSALIISGDGNATTDDIDIKANGKFDYSASNTSTSSNSVYFADPLSTVRTENGGTLYINSARTVAAFPAELPVGYQQPLYGRTIFDTGSTFDLSNVAGVALPIGGRTLSTLRLSGTARASMTVTPTNLPITIGSLATSITGNTLAIASTAPVSLGGLAPTGTLTGTIDCLPLTITNSLTWPAGLTMNGDVIIPTGVTVTAGGAFTIGAADVGNLLDITGTLNRSTFAISVNSAVAVRNGGQITGSGAWNWGTAGGLGVVSPTGLSAPPAASDFPGMTLGTTVPANFLTVPLVTAGTWVFCGDVADQAPGAFFAGGTAKNVSMRTTGSVKLTNNLNVTNRLRLTKGLLNTDTFKVTLGTSTAAAGTLSYPFAQNLATIQGTFERWYTTAALSGSDFPLSDGTNRRMISLTTSAASSVAGTIAVKYTAADPGGTINQPILINTGAAGAVGIRAGVVRTDGYWTITPGNGFTGGGTATYITDVTGNFGVDTLAGNASVIARPVAGAWTIVAGSSQGTPTVALVNGVQTASNPTAAALPYRLTRAGFAAFTAAAPQEVGVATTLTNAGPSGLAISASTIAENNAANATVGTLSATNDTWSGEALTYTLVSGTGSTDNALFNISGTSLRVTTLNALNYEAASSRSVRVRVTDGGYPYLTQDLVIPITVTDVNEAPTAVAITSSTVAENSGFLVGDLSTTDPDAGNTFTYTVTGGTDSASFNIVGNQLFFNSPPNYEAQSSYAVTVTSTDQGSLAKAQALTITVTDVNEAPSLVTISNLNVNENTTTVGNLGVIDPDAGATATYQLVSGTGSTNNALFQITGNVLSFITAPNYEAQTSYSVRVRATDTVAPNASVERAFTVSVKNVNEAPTSLTLSNNSIVENTTAVGTFSATDPDATASFTYALEAGVGGEDNGFFTITGNALAFTSPANFEAQASYNVRVKVTDGVVSPQSLTNTFVVTVTNAEEAPTGVGLSNTTVAENSGTAVGTLSATDDDAGSSITYSIGGTDAAAFSVTGTALSLLASPNFEVKASYSITVTATDNTSRSSAATPFTITITNVAEDPTDILLSNNAINEALVATTIGTLSLVDEDAGTTSSFALTTGTGDTNNALFAIAGTSLNTVGAPAPGGYSIRIRGTENTGRTVDKVFAITVNDVADVDGDGISDTEEGPTYANQPGAASFLSPVVTTDRLELTTSAGRLTALTAIAAPAGPGAPLGTNFPYGLTGFTVKDLANGATVTITLNFPVLVGHPAIDKVYKYQGGTYTEIASPTVGATSISYSITDGGTGDADGVANGEIVDPMGPSYINATVKDWTLLND